MTNTCYPTAAEICDTVGRSAIAKSVGVGLTAVSNAAVDGRFPARWFLAVKTLCERSGLACPPHLFNFAGVDVDRPANRTSALQQESTQSSIPQPEIPHDSPAP